MSKLKTIRESRGISRARLAEISGIGIRSIEGYEQGLRDINKAQVSTLLAIAKALHCNIEDIIDCR